MASTRNIAPNGYFTVPPLHVAVDELGGAASGATDEQGLRPGGRALGIVLCLLTVFGPISMDLYLPILPALTDDLQTSTSAAQ